jgi:N-acetyl sugar amidotransferase
MDESDPYIRFDSAGVCNHCHERDEFTARVTEIVNGPDIISQLVDTIKRDGKGRAYDCVIGVSGGVDSTFVAYETKRLGLRTLAVHLDNGWDSEVATSNIHNALDRLDIELHTHVIDWEEFRDIQLSFLKAGVVDLEIPSDHAIVSSVQNHAKKLGVRHTIWGYNAVSETHLPRAWSQGHYDYGYIRAIHRQYGTGKIRTFPYLTLWAYLTSNRFNQTKTNLLDYIDFNKQSAVEVLSKELGWKRYGGKHHENIYTRWYQGWYLPTQWGYDKRKTHLSSIICAGELSREAASQELAEPSYDPELQAEDIEYVMKKFSLSTQDFEKLMKTPRRTFDEFSTYRSFLQGPMYGAFLKGWQFLKYDVFGRSRVR